MYFTDAAVNLYYDECFIKYPLKRIIKQKSGYDSIDVMAPKTAGPL